MKQQNVTVHSINEKQKKIAIPGMATGR